MAEDDLGSLPGAGPTTTDKLVESGYDNYQSIAVASPGELLNRADTGSSTASDIINAAYNAADVGGFETNSMVLERRQQIGKLSRQIDEVDELPGGGLETQLITEVYDEFGAGKSQIIHQLTVNVRLLPEQGSLGGGCIFIDSEDAFRPEHIDDMTRGLEDEVPETTINDREMEGSIDDEEVIKALVGDFLGKIHVVKAFNSNHQTLLAEKTKELAGKYEDTEWLVRLLCVDSFIVHFRAEYVGRGEPVERQQKLNKHLYGLMRISDLFNMGILVTNQTSSNPDSYSGDPTQPVGGNILGHTLMFRIHLRKSKGDKRIVHLVDVPNLAGGEAIIHVRDAGLKLG